MMDNRYKKNWEETREIFQEWWDRRNRRPVLVCEPHTFLMGNVEAEETIPYGGWAEKWTDTEKIFKRLGKEYEKEHFAGEGYPFYSPYLGPGSLAAYMGARVEFGRDTIWFEPVRQELADISGSLDKENSWWEWTLKAIRRARRGEAPGMHISIPDIEMGLDIISALAGPENLLMALIEEPQEVHRLQKKVLENWKYVFDSLFQETRDEYGFSSYSHFYIMGKGKVSTLQCDFGTMISSEMFEEFMVPYLREYAAYTDCNIYHLDGVDNLRHLDAILEIPEIQCIQWTPGAGQPDGGDERWDEIYKKALEHDKNIYALMAPEKIPSFVKRFGKKGVYLRSDIADPRKAEEMMELLET